MSTIQPDARPVADMQNMMARFTAAKPNTIIGGSFYGSKESIDPNAEDWMKPPGEKAAAPAANLRGQ
jgi:hypothetical protein